MRCLLAVVGAAAVASAAAAAAPPTAYPSPRSSWEGTRLKTPPGAAEEAKARSGERDEPTGVKHFGGRVVETGDGWFVARSWFGLGARARFRIDAGSILIRHGEERPWSDLRRGDYVGVWYLTGKDGERLVGRVQIGGRSPAGESRR